MTANKWSKFRRQRVYVPHPTIIAEYILGMGMLARFLWPDAWQYRTSIWLKSWYWPIVVFKLNDNLVYGNMLCRWLRYNICYLELCHSIIQFLTAAPSFEQSTSVRSELLAQALDEVRQNSITHKPAKSATQQMWQVWEVHKKPSLWNAGLGLVTISSATFIFVYNFLMLTVTLTNNFLEMNRTDNWAYWHIFNLFAHSCCNTHVSCIGCIRIILEWHQRNWIR